MRREGTIGAATFLAFAAVVGFSVQTGPKPAESGRADRTATSKRSKPSITRGATREDRPGCGSLREQIEEFLGVERLTLPEQCYERDDPRRNQLQQDLTDRTAHVKFVIALLPD